MADIVVNMIQHGCEFDNHTVPDISVGMQWSTHWEKSNLDQMYGQRTKHDHNYPDWFPQSAANPVSAWIYPAGALGAFRVWMYTHYVQKFFPKYLEGKVKKGVFLPSRAEMLLESVSSKKLN